MRRVPLARSKIVEEFQEAPEVLQKVEQVSNLVIVSEDRPRGGPQLWTRSSKHSVSGGREAARLEVDGSTE